MIEITAIFEVERLRFENADGDTIIGTARIVNGSIGEPVAIKGKAERGELQQHLSYRFYGHWSEYTNNRTGKTESQFVTSLLDGKGFPKEVSSKIVKAFGNKAAEVIKRDPYQLMHFRGEYQ